MGNKTRYKSNYIPSCRGRFFLKLRPTDVPERLGETSK